MVNGEIQDNAGEEEMVEPSENLNMDENAQDGGYGSKNGITNANEEVCVTSTSK